MINHQVAPKAKIMRAVLAEIMDLPPEHPTVSRTVLNVMGPVLLMLIANRDLQQKVAPEPRSRSCKPRRAHGGVRPRRHAGGGAQSEVKRLSSTDSSDSGREFMRILD